MIELDLKKELNFAGGEKMLHIETAIEEGACVAIMGPSGSGKTTLLRLISGLTDAAAGTIKVGTATWLDTNKQINWPTQKRNIGYVFQNYALFPNMTIQENLEYALAKNQAASIVKELIEVMGLQSLIHKYPITLSGGQQQRVALARAIVRKPQILLLDEPLSALDEEMRSDLQDYILKIHQTYQLTTLLVSHDKKEIFKMAQQVYVLKEGKIMKAGTPTAIFGNSQQIYPLTGVVRNIEVQQKSVILKVQIGENFISIPSTEAEVTNLNVSDKLIINTSLNSWKKG